MSLKVFVKNSSNKAVVDAPVDVKWSQGGFSSGRTGPDGTFDTGINAYGTTVLYVSVHGRKAVDYGGGLSFDSANAQINVQIS